MKKMSNKGFTLIELLAVVIILGILMTVGGTAITRIIENTRKDTFIDTAKKYAEGTKTMWLADNLYCTPSGASEGYVSSAVPTGTYYVKVDTSDPSQPQILESGGKSSWGNRHVKGYILVKVEDVGTGEKISRKITYFPVLSDDVHGVNVTGTGAAASTLTKHSELKRGSLTMSGAKYVAAAPAAGVCIEN